jgi:hypothetical protein
MLSAITLDQLGTKMRCAITSLTKSVMLAAIREQPQFSNLFMDHLLNRNSRIEADVIDQLCTPAPASGELWEGRQSSHRTSHRKSGDACGNDRHHPIPGQPFHEQIPQIRLH